MEKTRFLFWEIGLFLIEHCPRPTPSGHILDLSFIWVRDKYGSIESHNPGLQLIRTKDLVITHKKMYSLYHGLTKTVKEKISELIFTYDSRPKIEIDHMLTLNQIQDYINNRRRRMYGI